jgi:hypothetical protein
VGELQAGLSAALLGAPLAIFLGGMATVTCVAVMIWRHKQLLRFDRFDPAQPPGG